MLTFDDILFTISLAIGMLLVLGSALGLSDALGSFDVDVDADVDADADTDGGTTHGGVLGLLGIGRVPLAVVLMLLTLLFGGTGIVAAKVLHDSFGTGLGGILAVVVASVSALVGTRVLSRVLSRVMPSTESYASHLPELVGRSATVVVAGRSGDVVARVLDDGGAELRVRCRVQGSAVKSGDGVLLVDYEAESDRFLIERLSLS